MQLSANARTIIDLRYSRKDEDGKPTETPDEVVDRVARNVAIVSALYSESPSPDSLIISPSKFPYRTAERAYNWLVEQNPEWDDDRGFNATIARGYGAYQRQNEKYRQLISNRYMLPNSPTWTGAGTPLGQLAACFVLPVDDDLGRSRTSIFETLKVAALIQQTGGGNGFDWSRLRPANSIIKTSMGKSSGPVGFMDAYNACIQIIAQGGSRRGANMGVLRCDHPDVFAFVKAKVEEGRISAFNISVAITDKFMKAVADNDTFDLVFSGKVYETIKARDLFDMITEDAWKIGDPGCLFIDRANRDNPCPQHYTLESTNPCVTGDTLVASPKGWVRADSVSIGDAVVTVLGIGQVDNVEVHDSMPVYEIVLSDGGRLKATAAHQLHARDSRTKFFTPTRVDELLIGQWIRVSPSVMPNNLVMPDIPRVNVSPMTQREFGFIVGVLVGDGSCSPKTLANRQLGICSSSSDVGWNHVVVEALNKMGFSGEFRCTSTDTKSVKVTPAPSREFARWFDELSLEADLAPNKVLPDEYINSNQTFLTGLLDGLFSTDGSVNLRSNHPQLRFHTASPKLAEQVRLILLSFGVHSRVSQSERKPHSMANGREIRYDRPKYDLTISGESFGRFYEQITLSHPDKQAKLKDARLRCNFTGGNWAAQIVSIKPVGFETVYDLHEPVSDTWITNGYVSRGCGEQWLPPYGTCTLGAIALQRFVTAGTHPALDWDMLATVVHTSMQFLDDVVDANQYVRGVPEVAEMAQNERRVGLGLMGVADTLAILGIRYGSLEAQEFLAQVTEFCRYHSMLASIERAKERGPFPWIEGSIYDQDYLKLYGQGAVMPKQDSEDLYFLWSAPPSAVKEHDFGRTEFDWEEVYYGLCQHGIRNACQFNFHPTGTVSQIADCEGGGIEPFFALIYERTLTQEDKPITLYYASPLFEAALKRAGLTPDDIHDVCQDIKNNRGSCQGLKSVPLHIQNAFVVAADIAPEEHVRMQAAAQVYVDNSISKTINFSNNATVEDVRKVYHLAHALGCKGITIYRQGSRQIEVLKVTEVEQVAVEAPKADEHWPVIHPMPLPPEAEKHGISSRVYPVKTAFGTLWVTITEHPKFPGRPFDVRAAIGKGGSDKNADAEAIGRAISLATRAGVSVEDVVDQLVGVGGRTFSGFGPKRSHSVADAIGKLLDRLYLDSDEDDYEETSTLQTPVSSVKADPSMVCPECHNATVVNESGCKHCDIRIGGCGRYSACD